ncbi:MAG: chromosome segregation protein SMC [Candidatus Limnocylindrales bacterium]
MSVPARLRSLRMLGFKSFAERTEIEFGPGISAIVGPNGSGKSNLADALRWALGEQGRSLRIRRAEDVIFAGSERRHAIGMADVTLVLDNADGLLPLEYGEIALSRRLFRSGENDYLVNRQRVRHRDLVELLDAANLAENAFLFIGQGTVDQALALRPEERRPLFEDVAGVRRHERRRRQAELQLAEAEANLARVRDVLAELRPQARRLAQQVEQEETRRTAADDLAAALVAMAHARWASTARAGEQAAGDLAAARAAVEAAQRELRATEARATALAAVLSERAASERAARAALEASSAALTTARIAQGRAESNLEALQRDRRRIGSEREAAMQRIEAARRAAAVPLPEEEPAASEALDEIELALAEAVAEIAQLRAAARAAGDREAALRRAEAARAADLEKARRRATAAAGGLRDQQARLARAEAAAGAAEARHAEALQRQRAALSAGEVADVQEAEARLAVERAEAGRQRLRAAAEEASAQLAASRQRAADLERSIAAEEGLSITQAARRRGGARVAEGLDVEPLFRAAVEAALGDSIRAAAIGRDRVPGLRGERGLVVLADVSPPEADGRGAQRARAAAAAAGGGMLLDAVRRDPGGIVTRLLATVLWVPSLEAMLEIATLLPLGWSVASLDGHLTTALGLVAMGGGGSLLDRRAEREAIAADLERLAGAEAEAGAAARTGEEAARAARAALEAARQTAEAARRERRAADEAERAAGRAAEAALRELAWERAQADRLRADSGRAAEALSALLGEREPDPAAVGAPAEPAASGLLPAPAAALATWERREVELREQRDRLVAAQRERAAARRQAEDARSRAEAALALEETRLAALEAEWRQLIPALEDASAEAARTAAEAASLAERERGARETLDALLAAAGDERGELALAEARLAEQRAHLRALDDRVRQAEVGALEARLSLESLREQTLVELASLGPAGIASLGAGETPEPDAAPMEDEPTRAIEAALDLAVRRWQRDPVPADMPTAGRIAALRRRFHELGAGNPLALQEYGEVRARVDGLEAQREDLERAIRSTRDLIGELDRLIGEQFRSTFAALEDAFERRFTQLFGGGTARLSLTNPDDLDTTGVEIVAQPPGKKRQSLSLLSGGERALTAVALLFAMLEVRPVPFCVLDEVDAALDEANVGRFADALRQLARTTQCVVITHNRGTIEAADALYGVTIGDDAASRVISLRLEEARTIVERAG